MKVRITEREVANTHNVIVCNHCPRMLDLCAAKYGYNAGVAGWNFDVRHIGRYNVIDGYRWVRKFLEIPYEWCRKWEECAKKVVQLPSREYDAAVSKLVTEFTTALDDFVVNGK